MADRGRIIAGTGERKVECNRLVTECVKVVHRAVPAPCTVTNSVNEDV
jgi:hypothetical protein